MQELETKYHKVIRLLKNQDFQDIIINDFIENGILERTLHQSDSDEQLLIHLKARQILNNYLFGIIDEYQKLKKD